MRSLLLALLLCSSNARAGDWLSMLLEKPTEVTHSEATLYGAVTAESVSKTIKQIHEANKTPGGAISLFIDSEGGSVFAELKLLDAMAASHRPVNTVCVGMCASAAAIVFLHGAERVMSPQSSLLLHDGTTGVMNSVEKVYSQIAMEHRIDADEIKFLANMCGLSESEVRVRRAVDWWMWPTEAKDMKFATQIANVPQYPTQ